MTLYKPQEAADMIGISYKTLKLWIYQGKIKTVKTAGGHHRVPSHEIERLTGEKKSKAIKRPEAISLAPGLDAISGRNKLLGTITNLKFAGLLAQVTLDVGGQTITSIITRDACLALKLKKGMQAYALIKATEVMIIRG